MSSYVKSLKELLKFDERIVLSYSGFSPAFVDYVASRSLSVPILEDIKLGSLAGLAKQAIPYERLMRNLLETFPMKLDRTGKFIFETMVRDYGHSEKLEDYSEQVYRLFSAKYPNESVTYQFNTWLEKNFKLEKWDVWVGGNGRIKRTQRIEDPSKKGSIDEFTEKILGPRSIEILSQ